MAMANYHADYISAINEVKQWLSYKALDEFIYLLLDHGYDDLSSIAECNADELAELVQLFTTPDSKKAISSMVAALREVGIDVYRKQKGEFRRLIDLDDRNARQVENTEEVSRPPTTAPASARSSVGASPAATAGKAGLAGAAVAGSAAAAAAASTPSSATSSTASPAAAAANPTLGFDVSHWDGAIHFQAYVHSLSSYSRAFDEAVLPPDALESKLLEGRTYSQLQKIQRSLAALIDGAVFKKFKRGSASRRMIWTSSALDFLLWGDEEKREVKGFISTSDIQEINQGFSKNKNRLYIVSPERTLELEAKDSAQAQEWKEMLELLIQLNIAELEAKKALQALPGFDAKFEKARGDFTKLLATGSVFKKSPGHGKVLAGFTTRLLWSPPVPDRLQWGDLLTRKVLGFVLMQDMVHIQENEMERTKFTIYAMKRSLDLEARNEITRDKWIKALRFFVEFKTKAIIK